MLLKRWILSEAHKMLSFPTYILIIVAALIHYLQHFPNYPVENTIDNIMIENVFLKISTKIAIVLFNIFANKKARDIKWFCAVLFSYRVLLFARVQNKNLLY